METIHHCRPVYRRALATASTCVPFRGHDRSNYGDDFGNIWYKTFGRKILILCSPSDFKNYFTQGATPSFTCSLFMASFKDIQDIPLQTFQTSWYSRNSLGYQYRHVCFVTVFTTTHHRSLFSAVTNPVHPHPLHFGNIHISYYPVYYLAFRAVSSLQVRGVTSCVHFWSASCIQHTLTISSSLIWPPL